MKKSTIAVMVAVMALVGVGSVSAQMVDIGSGQMEQAEFIALKAMVQGRQTGGVPMMSTPLARLERYGMVEMTPADFVILRDKVAGRNVMVEAGPPVKPIRMVNIGTGEMPMNEFITLKRMVEKTETFDLEHLAAMLP